MLRDLRVAPAGNPPLGVKGINCKGPKLVLRALVTVMSCAETPPAAIRPLNINKATTKRFTRTPARELSRTTYPILSKKQIKFLLNSSATELPHDFQSCPSANPPPPCTALCMTQTSKSKDRTKISEGSLLGIEGVVGFLGGPYSAKGRHYGW